MASSFPSSLDSYTANTDGVDDVIAADVNELQEAIVAIETELGTDPAGTETDVSDRLDAMLQIDGTHNIEVAVEPASDGTPSGTVWKDATVDTNAEGIGAPLFMAADEHFDTADADASTTAPCVALALETGTGTKDVLLHGVMRLDSWNWTVGPGAAGLIYVSPTVGTLTQTAPTGEDDVVQPVGYALTDDCMFFCPSLMYITHGA